MKVRGVGILAGFCVLAAAGAPPALAQVPDVQGSWLIQFDAFAPRGTAESVDKQQEPDCVYAGTLQVTNQDGGDFSGSASATRQQGDAQTCPGSMSASLQGTLSETAAATGGATKVSMIMVVGGMMGQLGEVNFTGDQNPDGSFAGSFFVPFEDGNLPPTGTVLAPRQFGGFFGNWVAAQQLLVQEIPALGRTGMLLLALLVVAAGWLLLARRRPAQA